MDEVCTQAQAHACPAARRLRGVVRLAAHEAMGGLMRMNRPKLDSFP